MTRRAASVLVAFAAPLVLASCGASTPDVAAPQAQPVATESWRCPNDVLMLESLQTAHEHLEGRPAASVAELESSGLLPDGTELAATITDGIVVGTSSDRCWMVSYAELGLEPHCAAALDRLHVDMFAGVLVSQHLGSSLGYVEQARAVGIDHGPHLTYSWNEDMWLPEVIDASCPDGATVEAALSGSMESIEEDPCVTAEKTLATAAEAYFAAYGEQPADQQTLVDEEFLRETYDTFELAPDGSVIAVAGSGCV